jgi:hypothetical protein
MKYIKTFEDLTHLDMLKQDAELRRKMEQEKELDKLGKQTSGQRLKQLEIESDIKRKEEQDLNERNELSHIVIQSLVYSDLRKPGFENFKMDLTQFLEKYPLDTLPKSGSSIYRR